MEAEVEAEAEAEAWKGRLLRRREGLSSRPPAPPHASSPGFTHPGFAPKDEAKGLTKGLTKGSAEG